VPLAAWRLGSRKSPLSAFRPARKEERRRNASRAGRSKPNREVAEIKDRLQELTEEVLSGAVATAPYAVANQLINTRLRAIELERKVKETEELEARIEELERTRRTEGGRRWG
jgi:hypothetical protein